MCILAFFMGISRSALMLVLTRLQSKGIILDKQSEEENEAGFKGYVVSEDAESILSEILFAISDFEQIVYEGFTREEIELYERLKENRRVNIKKAIR